MNDLLNAVSIFRELYEEARSKSIMLENACTKVTVHLTGMPGGDSNRDALLAKLTDAHDIQYERAEKLWNCIRVVKEFINSSPLDDIDKSIIIRRYVYGYAWKDIHGTVPDISERQMYYRHTEAVKKLTDYYESIEDKTVYDFDFDD